MNTFSNEHLPALENGHETAKVLIVDNYDSFTYNIREALAKLGIDSVIIRNDEMPIEEVEALNPSHIIISPGPGTPENPEDIGISDEVIAYAVREQKALLGVCLGHQAIARHFGGNIVQAEEILHGKTSQLDMEEDGGALFTDIDDAGNVMRYHSLVAEDASFPSDILHVTSRSRDAAQAIMSYQHASLPIAGMQFHPESFATESGQALLENFLNMAPEAYKKLQQQGIEDPSHAYDDLVLPASLAGHIDGIEQSSFEQMPFQCSLSPEQVYERLHGASDNSYTFESLDSNGGERTGRFSYFGLEPEFVLSATNNDFFLNDEQMDIGDMSAFDALNAAVEHVRKQSADGDDIPKEQRLTGGFVGGMSYEAIQYREPTVGVSTPSGQKTFSFGYFSDGLIYDNQTGDYSYYTRGADRRELFAEILRKEPPAKKTVVTPRSEGMSEAEFTEKVRTVRDEKIRTGESFQTVLSRKETYGIEGSMAPLYSKLRDVCPSGNMHAVKMGDMESIGSFPELTLKVANGEAVTYQVAGTRLRTGDVATDDAAFADLLSDPKERAEHMMLVDLARNDLAMSSIPGTVELTPDMLMHRLDAGKVMHMASEVRSRVNGIPPLQALLAIAPMGTVSGAPKVRSMQIINEMEDGQTRGLYAGSFGFVDMRGGLEAVVGLRSLMRNGDELSVQAGAGIVYDSDEQAEYRETELKKRVAKETLTPFLTSA
jgi:para-aminobenzoate synthetase